MAVQNGKPANIAYHDQLMDLANKWEQTFIFVSHYIPGYSIDYLNAMDYTRFFRVLREAEKMHAARSSKA